MATTVSLVALSGLVLSFLLRAGNLGYGSAPCTGNGPDQQKDPPEGGSYAERPWQDSNLRPSAWKGLGRTGCLKPLTWSFVILRSAAAEPFSRIHRRVSFR